MNEDFYTIEQAAEKMQVSERYLGDCIRNKTLKAHKQGKRFYILHSDLLQFITTSKED